MHKTDPKQVEHLYLVDGSGFIFRAYYAFPPLTRADGTPIGAVYGFTNMLMKLLDETNADHLAVIFDAARVNFRNDIYAAYKANRDDTPEDLIPQFSLIREATQAFNVPAIEQEGFEADDLIATYAKQAAARGAKVTIVSSDKDLMQLVNDQVSMFDPIKNKTIKRDDVIEKFGVPPEKVVDVQALSGDSVDNVPGVPGVGPKIAAQLINEFGDLETLLARAGEIKQDKRRENLIAHADDARISKRLVSLREDVTHIPDIAEFAVRAPDYEKLTSFLRANEFKTTLAKVESRAGAGKPIITDVGGDVGVVAPPPKKEASYELVTKAEELQSWIHDIYRVGKVAVDTETTSLDAHMATLVGVSLSVEAGRACYIPVGHMLAREQLKLKDVIAALKPVLEDGAILKIGQNIKYDMNVLAQHDIHIFPVTDTMVMSYVLEGRTHGHGMDELAQLYLDRTTISYKELVGTGKKQITFDQVPVDQALDYAAEDADITLQLYEFLFPRLAKEQMATVYDVIDKPLIPVLAKMEQAGIKVSAPFLQNLTQEFSQRLEILQGEIFELVGHEFNINSPKQLGQILFEEMGLPGGKKTKSGDFSTNVDVLEKLADEGHELPTKILNWRSLAKLKSTYTEALVHQINARTGRVHSSFAMTIANTGRLSSSDPNLQNIPIRTDEGREIRKAFIAAPGFKFMSADYSQIELRLLAEMAGIDTLRQAFQDGKDIHALTAAQVFGMKLEDVDPLIRRQAKAINFGIIYGVSPFGLAKQLGCSRQDAKEFIEAYFKQYPGIRDYMEQTKEFCRRHGYVETLFGRKCYMPEINDKNGMRRAFAERAAINAPLQGTAADIIKRAMNRMGAALVDHGLGTKMLLQVHDELLFEVPEDQIDATTELVKNVMEQACMPVVNMTVPLVVEVGVADNWADAH